MPQKKEELPMNVDVDLQNGGTITYANEVIAIIAGVAANEVEGVAAAQRHRHGAEKPILPPAAAFYQHDDA